MDINAFLSKIPILAHVDAAVFRQFLLSGDVFVKRYAKGSAVHTQNEHCQTLDVVVTGKLAAVAAAENGSLITLFEFQTNSLIGANLLFGENHLYPLSIYSVSDCELLHITQKAVLDFLHDYAFVMQFIKSLSLNSQGMNRKITMLLQKTLRENILEYLHQQSLLQKTKHITLPMSKKALADYFGVQRPSLFRELKKLQTEKKITVANRSVHILAD